MTVKKGTFLTSLPQCESGCNLTPRSLRHGMTGIPGNHQLWIYVATAGENPRNSRPEWLVGWLVVNHAPNPVRSKAREISPFSKGPPTVPCMWGAETPTQTPSRETNPGRRHRSPNACLCANRSPRPVWSQRTRSKSGNLVQCSVFTKASI